MTETERQLSEIDKTLTRIFHTLGWIATWLFLLAMMFLGGCVDLGIKASLNDIATALKQIAKQQEKEGAKP